MYSIHVSALFVTVCWICIKALMHYIQGRAQIASKVNQSFFFPSAELSQCKHILLLLNYRTNMLCSPPHTGTLFEDMG